MEKILIEVDKTIHTFERIKGAVKYKLELCEWLESSLGDSPNERLYVDNLVKYQLLNDPNGFYEEYIKGKTVKDIEEILIDLCMMGIDIDEYFVCKKQDKQKPGFCGSYPYRIICRKISKGKYLYSSLKKYLE